MALTGVASVAFQSGKNTVFTLTAILIIKIIILAKNFQFHTVITCDRYVV